MQLLTGLSGLPRDWLNECPSFAHRVGVGLVLASGLYFLAHAILFYSRLDFGADGLGTSELTDFFVFFSGARFLWEGGTLAELYDSPALKAFQITLGGPREGLQPFGYPPTYILLIGPFGGLSYPVALTLWQLATMGLLAVSLRAAGLKGFEVFAVLVAPTTIQNFSAGQNGCLTSALIIGGLVLMTRRQMSAGGLFGLLTVKPHLGLLVPVVCLAQRRWETILAAAGVTIGLVVASILWFGVAPWTAYWDFLVQFQAEAHNQAVGPFLVHSATVLMAEQILGLPKSLAYGVQILISLGVAVAVYRAYRHPVDKGLRLALTLVGVSLVTPYGFLYDLPFVAVAVILIARRGLREGFLPYEELCLLSVWLVPFFANALAELGVPTVPIFHLAFFVLILLRIRKDARAIPGHQVSKL
jgi:hypothetical protein